MSDPIIAAIEAFRTGVTYFNAIPTEVTQQMEEQIIAATDGPPLAVLEAWVEPARSLEGAIEALRMACEENEFNAPSEPVAVNMTKAALAYLLILEGANV